MEELNSLCKILLHTHARFHSHSRSCLFLLLISLTLNKCGDGNGNINNDGSNKKLHTQQLCGFGTLGTLELGQAQVQVLSELQDKFKASNLVKLSLKIQSKKTVDVI